MKKMSFFRHIMFTLIIVIVAAVHHAECAKFKYSGYKVFRAYPDTVDQLNTIRTMGDDIKNIDYWAEPKVYGRPVDIMVSPGQFTRVANYFRNLKIDFDVIIDDVNGLIEKEMKDDEKSQKMLRAFGIALAPAGTLTWRKYHRLSDIYNFMDSLALKYPDLVKVTTIGKTFEKREIKVLQIGLTGIKEDGTVKSDKKSIWIDGGIHAREWISPATVTYVIDQLISGYAKNDSAMMAHLHSFDWFFLPVVNPDGYEYSHTNSRMWRKNRALTTELFCKGVDLNRNFAFHWNEGGASNNPCSETYAGSRAMSELESKAISQFVGQHNKTMVIYLTLHSYGQFWLTPWGFTSDLPTDYDNLVEMANHGAKALKSVHGTTYTVGSATNVLYVASGGSDDWAKGVAGVEYVYTLELRDTGRFGFLLPASQIIPTCRETWTGIQMLANKVAALQNLASK